eukprot:1140377-Pelagomonas_calceolata.AAC.1
MHTNQGKGSVPGKLSWTLQSEEHIPLSMHHMIYLWGNRIPGEPCACQLKTFHFFFCTLATLQVA